MDAYIPRLMFSYQGFISQCFVYGVQVSSFVSLTTFNLFTSLILRGLALDSFYSLLGQGRKHLSKCENDARCTPYCLLLPQRGIHNKHRWRIGAIPVFAQLHDLICAAVQGLHLLLTGLPLHAGTGSFLTFPFHFGGKLPHMC
jgi:hypothetical protein